MIDRGSDWRRWEPHIHAPGTALNDQFGGGNGWDEWLTRVENALPKIEALAVTDYYLTDTYQEVLKYKDKGRLADVPLVFPNVEMRINAAAKSGFVNLHLLVSPEDPNHIEELGRFLRRLTTRAYKDTFSCTRDDLIALGKAADPAIIEDGPALSYGATQFKVDFGQLKEEWQNSDWARQNILVAVAGGSGDGTSGIRDAADTTTRREIEAFADIIFSGNPVQREFWSGLKALSRDKLTEHYGGCKPCLHGSDAHTQDKVGRPDQKRYSWVKGGLEFDSLRQACINPEGRAFVGQEPPRSPTPSQVISHVSISDADWAKTSELALNPGLVAIIGARGSGKTALADIIAAGCDAISPEGWGAEENNSPSFLSRARELLRDETATLTWGGGTTVNRFLDGRDVNNQYSYPRARYLSQQFVEELCSATGASEGLVEEIERVIFEAHSHDDREGAIDFQELRGYRTDRYRQARQREEQAVADISDRVATEIEKKESIVALRRQVEEKKALIEGYNRDLAKLVVKGTEKEAERHAEIGRAAQAARSKIQAYGNQRRSFVALQDEVASTRATKAPEILRQAQERHQQSGLKPEEWNEFLLIYKGDVDASLSKYIDWVDQQVMKITGPEVKAQNPKTPIVSADADLGKLTLKTLEGEMKRLEAVLSEDRIVRDQYAALSKRITNESSTLETLRSKLEDAEGAAERQRNLQSERVEAYARLFQAIINEQNALADLYTPLIRRLETTEGTLKKLGFSVRRIVNVESWGTFAEEELLDRRKAGDFQGRGALIREAKATLQSAWEDGSAAEVQAAMNRFINKHMSAILAHAQYSEDNRAEYRAWMKKLAHWLFDTSHISVRYDILYDGVDIRKLSPGTRGIVLLLLYLALDDADDRPLIIDQPEENLDPKSVFDELVSLFVAAKTKRQVIMVTHNANLVINTDADQVIVAEAGGHSSGGLPQITYRGGGLENADIRKAVCDILEGGEQAFRERARRVRVKFEK
ncbi:TrlF family AAA-like ATPase (plasmid) [Limimaricola variabilis]